MSDIGQDENMDRDFARDRSIEAAVLALEDECNAVISSAFRLAGLIGQDRGRKDVDQMIVKLREARFWLSQVRY